MNRSRRLLRTALTIPLAVGGAGALAATPFMAQIASAAPTCPTNSTECINTIAGTGTRGYSGDNGPAVSAELNLPSGITLYPTTGTVYFSDSGNNVVRQIVNPTTIKRDIITTYAGNGTAGYKGDGGLAKNAELDAPTGVAVDSSGDIFIADTGNNVVREVVALTGDIKTVAGNGTCSKTVTNGVSATSTSLCLPTGVAVDSKGNLYISDTGHFEVRKVSGGTITDYAGNGKVGYSGDGGAATSAELGTAAGIAIDASNNLYIADTLDTVVRKVTSGGTISTFAGDGKFGYAGDGGKANSKSCELDGPTGVGVDGMGDVYISDTLNNVIREVNAAGNISTFAGNHARDFSGDGGPATSAELNTPTGNIAANATTLFFSDTGNERLRGVFQGPPPVLPETQWAIFLPLGAILLGGGALFLVGFRRRRHADTAASAA
jgi:trimeric autotransporter adhesin